MSFKLTMDGTATTNPNLLFTVNQIICLEHQYTFLYGEVIQLLPERRLCWFRPMCMTKDDFSGTINDASSDLINLESCSDLLWPMSLFRPALDTEVISFLHLLSNDAAESSVYEGSSSQHLNKFIQQVWQANKDKF